MKMETEDLKRVSMELAQIMDDIGVNEEMVSLRRHVSLILDRYMSIRWNGLHLKHVTVGSQIEGSTTLGMMSDTDGVTYNELSVACVHLSDYQDSKTNYLVIKEPMCLPQCCCLQPAIKFKNDMYFPMRRDSISETGSIGNEFICDKHGRMFLNSNLYIDCYLLSRNQSKCERLQQHGPACSLHNFDGVYAERCLTLPDNCRVLFTRPRPGHWPTQGTLSKAEQCEVYMVNPGVLGHSFEYDNERRTSFIKLQYQNKYVDSQFRISTNMIERLLMFDLNIVQMKAYVITKMIRKEFLQPLVDERLSTFHMKTALLFTIEQFPENIWRDDNLLACVIYCLNTLKRFLERGYCPHYTISSVNLFAEKLTKNQLQILNENVTEMIDSRLRCLRKLCMDDVGLRLSASSLCVRNDNIIPGAEIRLQIIIQKIQQLRRDHDQPHSFTYNESKLLALAIESTIATDNELKNELEFICQSMCSNLASQGASDCIANGIDMTSDIISMYKTSLRSKDITNHLRYASMLVCTRQFERARALLETIEDMIAPGMIKFTESSTQRMSFNPKSDQSSNKCTSTEIVMEYAAKLLFPLVFVRTELNCVPGHLIYEQYRVITEDEIKCAEIICVKAGNPYVHHVFKSDVNAFLYYLQYLSSNNKYNKLVASDKLKNYCHVELHNRTDGHFPTALNMLGHVFELENDLPGAWALYRLSVEIKPRYNAAYWHLFRLFGNVWYNKYF